MFKIIAVLALIGVVFSAPADQNVEILKSELNHAEDGSFSYAFETGDGTAQEASAVVVNQGSENEHLAVKGSYRYIDPDGQTVEVTYTADENGYVPQGNIINPDITNLARNAANVQPQ